jgi:hypothetical protein
MISFSADAQRADDWIILPQTPPRFPEHDAELHCMEADRSEHREVADAAAPKYYSRKPHSDD